jgi:hypothetical protein
MTMRRIRALRIFNAEGTIQVYHLDNKGRLHDPLPRQPRRVRPDLDDPSFSQSSSSADVEENKRDNESDAEDPS